MVKKIILGVVILIVVIAAGVFFYRYQILQYTAEKFVRGLLPDYVRIDAITFEPQKSEIAVKGFRIVNPPDFSSMYLLEIDSVTCRYKARGKSLLDGFEVLEPAFKEAALNIERLGDGRVNLEEMKKFLQKSAAKKATSEEPKKENRPSAAGGGKKLADIIKLPENFTLKNGKVIFTDRLSPAKPHIITFQNINAQLLLKLDDSYTSLLSVASTGEGNLNGNQNEIIKWVISLNPQTPKLTMSNRFEVSGVDVLTFEPYYDKYSPIVFKKGKFSGTLIFDFDNGNIGSTNEIHLSNLLFYIKRGYENSEFWGATVQDLAKYFSSPFGDIVFDFKIKGDIAKPQFYLGPISKQALTSMAIDKVSSIIEKASKSQQPSSGGAKSDLDKAGEYIEMFKELMKKK